MKGIIAFVLLAFGTLGLIINEFIYTMGSSAVFVFSLSNVLGLTIFFLLLKKESEEKENDKI